MEGVPNKKRNWNLKESLFAVAALGMTPAHAESFPTHETTEASTTEEAFNKSPVEALKELENLIKDNNDPGESSMAYLTVLASIRVSADSGHDVSAHLTQLHALTFNKSEGVLPDSLCKLLLRLIEKHPLSQSEAEAIILIAVDLPKKLEEESIIVLLTLKDKYPTYLEEILNSDLKPSEYLINHNNNEDYKLYHEESPRVHKLLEDPNLAGIDATASLIPREELETTKHYVERVTQLQRYLSFRNIKPTLDNIETAKKEIQADRERWGNYEVFSGTTLYAADGKDDGIQFIGKNSKAAESTSKSFQLITGEPTMESLDAAREEVLTKIVTTGGKVNVVFSMHGMPDSISVGHTVEENGEEVSVVIEAIDIIESFKHRYENAELRAQAKKNPDVIILANCYSGSFAMKIIEGFRAAKLPLPIIITIAEAGQSGFGDNKSGVLFLDKLLQVQNPKLSDIYNSNDWDIGSNPVVIVPDKEDSFTPSQIAENSIRTNRDA